MGLDMYLEKMPKVDGYTFEDLRSMEEAVRGCMLQKNAGKVLSNIDSENFEQIAHQYGFYTFVGETFDGLKSRMNEYILDPEIILAEKSLNQIEPNLRKQIFHSIENRKEVAYWRKANQIHGYFIDNVANGVDDCEPFEVHKKDLEDLLRVCMIALEDRSRAGQLLPSQGGFFFGSTDYDEYYFEDLKETVKIVKKVLRYTDFDKYHLLYQASW